MQTSLLQNCDDLKPFKRLLIWEAKNKQKMPSVVTELLDNVLSDTAKKDLIVLANHELENEGLRRSGMNNANASVENE
jgi:hypothetical protein